MCLTRQSLSQHERIHDGMMRSTPMLKSAQPPAREHAAPATHQAVGRLRVRGGIGDPAAAAGVQAGKRLAAEGIQWHRGRAGGQDTLVSTGEPTPGSVMSANRPLPMSSPLARPSDP